MGGLVERYADRIKGVLSCFDRLLIRGTLVDIGHAEAASGYLYRQGIRVFDFEKGFAEPLRDEIRARAEAVAAENGLKVDYIQKKNFRKDDRIREILAVRGEHPGLVHVFSAMEPCSAYRPWFDKEHQVAHLRYRDAKCLHYYFYFVHPQLGLCFLRVPTWAPFRVEFYLNGHSVLARQLAKRGIEFTMLDNAFASIDDFEQTQEIADGLRARSLHRILDATIGEYCPALRRFTSGFHWTLAQGEYSTDIIFRRPEDLASLYDVLTRTAIHAVKADDVATFLGKRLTPRFEGELGGNYTLRIEGRRIRHHMGRVSIKMYDKGGFILRIETTVDDVSFFRHYRLVEHRDGSSEMKNAPMRKTIYSLEDLRTEMESANQRYIDYLAALDDTTPGAEKITKISKPVRQKGRPYRGFNVFDPKDLQIFQALAQGENAVRNFRSPDLRQRLPELSGPQMSRILKRLRLHGLARRLGRTYKYTLTALGQTVVLTCLKLREMFVIPELAKAAK